MDEKLREILEKDNDNWSVMEILGLIKDDVKKDREEVEANAD
jgi:hypothetical protein